MKNQVWKEECLFTPNIGYRRAIIQGQDTVVEYVDNLDKSFVTKIIDHHNKAINSTMEKYIRVGVEIERGAK